MFIKLTKFDNRPIWLNASFIVTVEPRRDGVGSVVVPIGDGFDYDVRESVEEVLVKLDGAPAPAVVPVPAPDCLTKSPADVSPDPEPVREPVREVPPMPAETPKAVEAPKEAEEKKPRKRAVRAKVPKGEKPAAKKTSENEPETSPVVPPLELPDDQVLRLVKLAPKSVGKLKNTLATQFHIADVSATVLALEARGVLKLDGSRVIWSA